MVPSAYTPTTFSVTEIASGEYGNLNRQLAKSFTPDSSEECNKKTLDHPVLTAYGGKIMNKKASHFCSTFYWLKDLEKENVLLYIVLEYDAKMPSSYFFITKLCVCSEN